jgi:hypothetical protein
MLVITTMIKQTAPAAASSTPQYAVINSHAVGSTADHFPEA